MDEASSLHPLIAALINSSVWDWEHMIWNRHMGSEIAVDEDSEAVLLA